MITRISTKCMDRGEWCELRRGTIGGSDAATVIGLNPYASPYSLWAEKTGRVPEKEDNEAMRIGRDLEEYVAQRFCEASGKKVRRDNHTYFNAKYPWAHANIDRVLIGEDAGLECKTTTPMNWSKFTDEEFPKNYYVQAMHYMAVTGKSRWYIACLVLGVGFKWYCVERNEDEIHTLMIEEQSFHKYVTDNIEPPVDDADATGKALDTLYNAPTVDEARIVGLEEYEDTIKGYMLMQAEISRLETIATGMKNTIKSVMKSDERGESLNYKVSWRGQCKNTFDIKRFAKDHPEINLTKYYKESQYRVFTITEKRDEEN